MIWLLFILAFPAFSQADLSAIQELDEELPNYNDYKMSDEELEIQRQNRKFRSPVKIINLDQIKQSGNQTGAMNPGAPLINIETNKAFKLTRSIYSRFLNLEDEFGFKYLLNKDGSVTWKIQSQFVVPIKEELSLYEPPLRYTPAPENIVRSEYDKKLTVVPEFSFYSGYVQGTYFSDLFDDEKAGSGISNQYGFHAFTNWKIPIKAGAVFHYERASYDLSDGEQIIYSSASFGPLFKTRDYEVFTHPIRFQLQFRVSPFAKATNKTTTGEETFKFNSADLLFSVERPIKNRFGEFILGFYTQSQWLSLKDQPRTVSVNASNATNKSFGILFAQVFE